MVETKILVAARQAWGLHCSGFVRARMRAQAGSEGMTLNNFGNGPDLYPRRKTASLDSVTCRAVHMEHAHTLNMIRPIWSQALGLDQDVPCLVHTLEVIRSAEVEGSNLVVLFGSRKRFLTCYFQVWRR